MQTKITLTLLPILIAAVQLTAQTPYLVKDLNPTVVPTLKFTDNLIDVNGTLFFTNAESVYKSDGTNAGTVVVKFNYSSNTPKDFINVNGTLFFTDWNTGALSGREVWKTDGTPTGTVMVKDINPVQYQGSDPSDFVNVNGVLYFWANDGVNGLELWKTDGTDTGTVMVKDIYQGTTYPNIRPSGFAAVNNTLFFSAITDSTGSELWKSDGTANGTVLVKEIRTDFNMNGLGFGSVPMEFAAYNGELFFVADDSTHGQELWKSDGTEAGTILVKDVNPLLGPGIQHLQYLTVVGNTLFFEGNDNNGGELWKSDGTEAGTVMVKNICPGPFGHSFNLTDVNGTLYFVATDCVNYYQLWKSDGTDAGTVMVKAINQNFADAFGYNIDNFLTNAGGVLYFPADDAIHGIELWKSDGTNAGTNMVMDIDPTNSNNGSHPEKLTAVGNNLFFTAFEPNSGVELWSFDFTTGLNKHSGYPLSACVYPNPSTGVVSLKLPNDVINANTLLSISFFDQTGRLAKQISFTSTQLSIDCSHLMPGIYQYTVQGKDFSAAGRIALIK